MGVTGLWTVLQPCARPVKIETLNKKRLAIDASIWIYQFLKAVRDKEGNALRNSHVVGFFRRICKLLFIGIKPVFVFDGGAPILKRETIGGRKARREGRREDAVRTAGKLLGVQMRRRAEGEERRHREERDEGRRRANDPVEEELLPENLVYVDELQMTTQERVQNRQFKKTDAYHLPALDAGLADMGAPNDPRIMSHEELEEYARQFHTGEDVNVYDFSKIDFNGPFFMSLPASDRYNILNAARLRSRLRMGYSKDQLDTMFPDRMAFSRFQIERVKERNELTQRLMNLNGMNGEDAMLGINGGGRVAGEKGKEYVLVKNDGVEGGWALGVVSNKREGEQSKPIDVDDFGKPATQEDEDDGWEDDGFEDVPIEGLNRLPKRQPGSSALGNGIESDELTKQRQALYQARQKAASGRSPEMSPDAEEIESLFIQQDSTNGNINAEERVVDDLFEEVPNLNTEEDDDLRRAIAMSLEQPGVCPPADETTDTPSYEYLGPNPDQPLEFNQKNAKAGRKFAQSWNARARGAAPMPFMDESDGEENTNLENTLEESSRNTQNFQADPKIFPKKPNSIVEPFTDPSTSTSAQKPTPSKQPPTFDGPLPFESLSLGTSILRKKKKKPIEEEAGGFEKPPIEAKQPKAQPLPPWFSGEVQNVNTKRIGLDNAQYEEDSVEHTTNRIEDRRSLKKHETGEVIDLDAPGGENEDVIEVESSSEDGDDVIMEGVVPVDSEVRMGDVADLIRAEPPTSDLPHNNPSTGQDSIGKLSIIAPPLDDASEPEVPIEWEESDLEDQASKRINESEPLAPKGGNLQTRHSKSSTPEFENVGIINSPTNPQPSMSLPTSNEVTVPSIPKGESTIDALAVDDEDDYSDPEEADLMRQLAIEAEEHARFASTLNSKSQLQNAEDYDAELRQLRNQQKKDRRDADEVSHIMITECQQLLKLFGLPYVTAPMEAEAQCAELVSLGLVDGIVTDDSDIFLFGGTRVYKNMFNQAKFVECYLSSDLEKEYSLDRHKLIRIAHLLGSDYTEGLASVGPVTALEILSEFEKLEDFSEWWSQVQLGQPMSAEDAANPFRRKFKRNASKLFLPAVFPDKRVDHAYLHPDVDSDPSPFAWGVPDLDALRSYLMATIGWSQERTDEVLVPVIKDMNRRENEGTQANITQFFDGGVGVGGRSSGGTAFAPRRRTEQKSKRMENALGRLHQQARNRTIGEGAVVEIEDGGEVETPDANAGLSDGAVSGKKGKKERVRTQKHQAKSTRGKKRAASGATASASDESESEEYRATQKPRKRGKAMAKAGKPSHVA